MPRIAISGHRGLATDTARLIEKAIRAALTEHAGSSTGLSCLADGADQIFARVVLDLGGDIEAVIPAEHYREALPEEAHQAYDELLSRATAVHQFALLRIHPGVAHGRKRPHDRPC